jgi:hypothetical protein
LGKFDLNDSDWKTMKIPVLGKTRKVLLKVLFGSEKKLL